MILTKELWDYIIEKQRILDAAFMKNPRFIPDTEVRDLAGLIEVDEFVKEFKETYKWWSFKPNDRAKIADEYCDILHFIAGLAIERKLENEYFVMVDLACKAYWTQIEKAEMIDVLKLIRLSPTIVNGLGVTTALMERLEYTTEEIRVAYDIKNKVNFERIASGVY